MAGETQITVVGNATADAELRFTQNGKAVANWTIASTPRVFDRQANEWRDGDALFLRCSVWGQFAENVADTVTRGTRLIVQGELVQRSYDTKEGEKRTVVELKVSAVGPDLRYASAKVNRVQRNDGYQSQAQRDAESAQWNDTRGPAARPQRQDQFGQQPLGVNADDIPF